MKARWLKIVSVLHDWAWYVDRYLWELFIVVMAVSIVAIFVYIDIQAENTDPPSGLVIYVDPLTGCEYLAVKLSGSRTLTERRDGVGRHIGCR